MANFSPREIVSELDRFIVGQNEAKKPWPSLCATVGAACRSQSTCAKKSCRKTF